MAGTGMHPYHQPWPPEQHPAAVASPLPLPHPHPPPPPPNPSIVTPPPLETLTSSDEVRTIFISGLPADVKERELQNLMRWLPGYEASQVNYKGEFPLGFALFSNTQFAHAAKDALQDMVFDADAKSVLHLEMAKKNLFIKRGIGTDSNSFDQSKRLRTGGDHTQAGYVSPTPFHAPPPPVWAPHGYLAPVPPPYDSYAGYAVPQPMQFDAPAPVAAPSSYVPVQPVQNIKDNPPCNTLFIGNLGEGVIEEELRGLFSVQLGFKQMKVLRQERHTVCFIEFEDVNSAANVHHNLQGAVIPSSGIRFIWNLERHTGTGTGNFRGHDSVKPKTRADGTRLSHLQLQIKLLGLCIEGEPYLVNPALELERGIVLSHIVNRCAIDALNNARPSGSFQASLQRGSFFNNAFGRRRVALVRLGHIEANHERALAERSITRRDLGHYRADDNYPDSPVTGKSRKTIITSRSTISLLHKASVGASNERYVLNSRGRHPNTRIISTNLVSVPLLNHVIARTLDAAARPRHGRDNANQYQKAQADGKSCHF
ncbi:RNA-binding protein with multiple splicing-like protein [Drosera capensis]